MSALHISPFNNISHLSNQLNLLYILSSLRKLQAMIPNQAKQLNRKKLLYLLTGIAGIYVTFCVGGVLHQRILKQPYIDNTDHSQNIIASPSGMIAFQKFFIFFFGYLYNLLFFTPNTSHLPIPTRNSIICAIVVFTASLTSNIAIILVSYPIVIMFKSCNILTVIIIGVFCSRVKNKNQKLTGNKLLVAVVVSVGIVIFKVFDPEAKVGDERKVELLGLLCLLVSLLADGFLPDFQAEIKEKYKPEPTVMMVQITKWCTIVSVAYCVLSLQIVDFVTFSWRHPLFLLHMFLMSILSFIGHIFIYNMIKEFKQHIVPFVITTRKIITVGISMLYFKHTTSALQLLGIVVVFMSTMFEFLSEVMKGGKESDQIPLQQKGKELPAMNEENVEKVIKSDGVLLSQRKVSEQQIAEKMLKE